jgi:transposase
MGNSVAREVKEGKAIQFLSGETVHVGIDTHLKMFHVTVWSELRGKILKRWTQAADLGLTLKMLEPFGEHVGRVVYEAGPCGYALVRALRKAGFPAEVIAPSHTPRTPGQQAKSDRLDSHKLAMWSAKGLLRPIAVPSEEQEADRQVFRMRDAMQKELRRVKQQIKSFLLMHGIAQPEGLAHWTNQGLADLAELPLSAQLRFSLDLLLEHLAHCKRMVAKATRSVEALARTKRHSRAVLALKSVPGIGPITSMAVRTELVAPERFDNGTQVAAMVGLAPWTSQSGQTRKEGSLMKGGNKRLRTMIIEAAWRWVKQDPWANERFFQLMRTTGQKKKAIGAMARRLAIILWPKPCAETPPPRGKAKPRKGQPGLPDKSKTGKETAPRRAAPASV